MNLMNLKHIIKWFVPFGMVRWHAKKCSKARIPKETFMMSYRKYINSGQILSFAEHSPFETVVSVQGFGYSGSGAVVDLLREYDTIFVIGSVDYEGSVSSRSQHCEEVDILRLAGGLFEVERFLGSNNIFQNDALLHRVIAQIENSEIYKAIPETHPYFYEYLNRICDVLTDSPQDQYYNTHLYYGDNFEIFYLKEISLNEYREICRQLLNSLFTIIKGESVAPILVLDQFVSDSEFDVKKYLCYIPNLKLITVYRDPRDVFTFARLDDVGWIPHTSADVFVKWYNIMMRHFNVSENSKYLVVRFEELIDDYDLIVDTIERYIGVNKKHHVEGCNNFNPTFSRKNMYIWKHSTDETDSYDTIYSHLHQFCYDN